MTTLKQRLEEKFGEDLSQCATLKGNMEQELFPFIFSECERARGEVVDEVRDLASEILDEEFPKTNQDNPTRPSKSGRAFVLVFYGFLLVRLRSLTHTKL